jgi:hypothetical protein
LRLVVILFLRNRKVKSFDAIFIYRYTQLANPITVFSTNNSNPQQNPELFLNRSTKEF